MSLSLLSSAPKMLVRSIHVGAWAQGLALFDGTNPVKVEKHMSNPSRIWLFTVELWEGKATYVTRLNDVVVRREFPQTE